MATYTVDQNRNWYNGLPTKRSSSAMILRDGDYVLMVKDDYKPHWTFPGGVIDAGESPFAAAIRETHEEVGLRLYESDVQFYSVSYVPERNGFLDRLHFFFISDVARANITVSPEKGIESFDWVSVSRIGELSGNRPGYVKLQAMMESGEHEYYFEAQSIK
jgi:8-oxo-dGTP diphosphatase